MLVISVCFQRPVHVMSHILTQGLPESNPAAWFGLGTWKIFVGNTWPPLPLTQKGLSPMIQMLLTETHIAAFVSRHSV